MTDVVLFIKWKNNNRRYFTVGTISESNRSIFKYTVPSNQYFTLILYKECGHHL